ncbi:MAG: hypothetical protein V1871_07820 [Planctomycetota bacterium]
MIKLFSISVRVLVLLSLFSALAFTGDNNDHVFLTDMPYDDKYLSLNYGDLMQKPSYDDVRCLALIGDNYVVAGTSCGVVVWNIKESAYQILPIEKDWTPENVEKEYFAGGKTPQPRTETGKGYFQRWTKNTVKNIYVLADGRIWADTFNGSAIFKNNVLHDIFNSDEEAIAAQYEAFIANKTVWKNWLVSKNGYIFLRQRGGRLFDGKQWKNAFVDDKMQSMLYDWYLDRDGMIWAKVWPALFRFDGNKWEKLLNSGPIAFYQAINGTVWVGDMYGVAEFADNTYKWYKDPGYTCQILETKDGKLWFFGRGCATSWDGKEWKQISFPKPYDEISVNVSFYSSDNSIWLFDNWRGFRFDGEQIHLAPEGHGGVKSYLQASNGDIWLILRDKPVVIKGNKISMLKGKEIPGNNLCRQIIQGKDGSIWVGSQEGFWQFKDGNWKCFSVSKATPKAPENFFEQYLQNLVLRASFGNYDKIKGMKEQELSDFLTKGALYSPGEFVVAYLRLKKTNEKMAVDACSQGLQRVLTGQMKGFSSSEAQMWIGLCGRDLMPPLVKLLETTKDEQIRFRGATFIPTYLTKEDSDVIANLFQHENLKDSLRARRALAECLFRNRDVRGVEYLVVLLKAEGGYFEKVREDSFITLSLLASISNDVPTKSDYELWSVWLKKNRDTIKLSDIDLGESEGNIALCKRLSEAFMKICYQNAE